MPQRKKHHDSPIHIQPSETVDNAGVESINASCVCYSRLMIVMKFGGTSVEDAVAIDRSCGIVAQRISRKPLVVVSALAGTTNGLLEAGRLAGERKLDEALAIIAPLEKRHVELLPSTATDFASLRELLRALSAIGETVGQNPRSDCLLRRGAILADFHRPVA